ncbi:MAG: hypothetical protein ACI81R_001129 [Bradymonadia bacterium]|jgi:hypothetical protein
MAKKTLIEDLPPALGSNPLVSDDISSTFFGPRSEAKTEAQLERPKTRRKRRGASVKTSAPHYKIVSISLYNNDIDRIDELVSEWKAAGYPKANRSALIRYAISKIDASELPKGW